MNLPSERQTLEIASKLRITGSLETALGTCGISEATFSEWAQASRQESPDPLLTRLMEEIAGAEAEIKMIREHQLTGYFEKNWQALAWWLERKYPDEYGPKAKAGDAKPATSGDEADEMFNLLTMTD